MIKEIIFLRTNDFSSEPIKLTFSKKTNVIIGPKGGGKSTLFDLIAGLRNNYISDNVEKALETYNLKFDKAVLYSNEEIISTQLSRKKKKEKEEDYKNRFDVIYQDDQIKKDLTSIKDIEENKFKYIKKQFDVSPGANELILRLKNLYSSMNKINDYFRNEIVDINWTNTFKMKELMGKDALSLITKLDYKNIDIKNLIQEEIQEYKNVKNSIEDFKTKLNRLRVFDKTKILLDQDFENNILNKISLLIKENENFLKIIESRIFLLERILMFSKIFSNSYRKVLDKIKNENFQSSGLKNYEIKSKNHFKNLASDIFNVINNFENIVGNDLEVKLENDNNQEGSLIYELPKTILINEDLKNEILKVFFHSPGSSINDITKWLKSLTEKGIKEFNEDKIRNKLCSECKNEVKVCVYFDNEWKNYESLSLGQKSIYGLKYKFSKSISDNLYLDQPEDNLDNNTIAKEILPMFEKKSNNQVFIVTHNANIGILTKPEVVIIADLNDTKNPYKIASIKEVINDESAHYLEGGKEYLEQRYNTIIKKENE